LLTAAFPAARLSFAPLSPFGLAVGGKGQVKPADHAKKGAEVVVGQDVIGV
jgi:hypothetical protein